LTRNLGPLRVSSDRRKNQEQRERAKLSHCTCRSKLGSGDPF
jgi:hypothetical protein